MADNPYKPPQEKSPEASIKAESAKPTEPLSLQAAKFSLYAPFILVLINLCSLNQQEQSGVRQAIGILAGITIIAALSFGIVGLVGGIMRRAWGTILMALGGLLLNGLIVYTMISVVVLLRERLAG